VVLQVLLATKHGSAGAPFHRQPAIDWIFTQTKLNSTYRRKFLCLDEASRVACNSDETQTNKIVLLFGGDGHPGKIQASVCQEFGNFVVMKRCSRYQNIYRCFFYYVM